MKTKHKVALFIFYFILFATLGAMVDYYAYDTISPKIFIALSFIGAIVATIIHSKSKTKTKADEIAKEIEEIL